MACDFEQKWREFDAWIFGRDALRCDREWAGWDGTQQHGEAIVEAQCARWGKQRALLGIPDEASRHSHAGGQ